MKWMGTALLLGGGYLLRRLLLERKQSMIAWGEELCALLDVLECGVMLLRRPLPDLLREFLKEAEWTKPFLRRVLKYLPVEGSFQRAWRKSVQEIPPLYRPYMEPLGEILTAGERRELIQITREEVRRRTEEERQQMGITKRLITALCFSGAMLTALVLI